MKQPVSITFWGWHPVHRLTPMVSLTLYYYTYITYICNINYVVKMYNIIKLSPVTGYHEKYVSCHGYHEKYVVICHGYHEWYYLLDIKKLSWLPFHYNIEHGEVVMVTIQMDCHGNHLPGCCTDHSTFGIRTRFFWLYKFWLLKMIFGHKI